ncbi:MAG: phosphoribosylanthranilate isomerase [Alphaproteobacteria bacterium]|nr:phosphoribosylanthranilate isomerase [Alphaproteobacteria bacterium]MDP6620984.1 phosphoribosylanthranilate isomerase [Alphaproteobacteria bacterium]
MSTRTKICCMMSPDEARLAVEYGADAVGLVSEMPSGAGVIGDDLAAEIAFGVPPGVMSVLLTSRQDVGGIVAQQRVVACNAVQLVDELREGSHAELRAALPGISILQVIHVTGPEAIDQAQAVAPAVDAVLLDSGDPSLAVKELGGTGRVHNWEISRQIVASLGTPVFLAGGLHAGNVGEAIARVRPYGVDLCNGVRTAGELDEAKLRAFMAAVAAA